MPLGPKWEDDRSEDTDFALETHFVAKSIRTSMQINLQSYFYA